MAILLHFGVRVKISNSQILEWLIFRIWELTNVQIQNVRTYESHYNIKWNLCKLAKLQMVRNIEWTKNFKIS